MQKKMLKYVVVYEQGYSSKQPPNFVIKDSEEAVIRTIHELTNKEVKHQYDDRVEVKRVFAFDAEGNVTHFKLELKGFKLVLTEVRTDGLSNDK